MKGKLINGGNLTLLGACILVTFGFLVVYLSLEYLPRYWLKMLGISIGLCIASAGGFSGRATALDLKPFTNGPLGWRKAKKTYEKRPEADATEDSDR